MMTQGRPDENGCEWLQIAFLLKSSCILLLGEKDSGLSLQVDAHMPLVYPALKYEGDKTKTKGHMNQSHMHSGGYGQMM